MDRENRIKPQDIPAAMLTGTKPYQKLGEFVRSFSYVFGNYYGLKKLALIFQSMAEGYSPTQAKTEIAQYLSEAGYESDDIFKRAESILDKAKELKIIS
jgi:hypothetical protein